MKTVFLSQIVESRISLGKLCKLSCTFILKISFTEISKVKSLSNEKDENVLVDSRDIVKLIDFGSCYFSRPGERVLVKSGTVQYLPPEVLQGQECDPRKVDSWCLGIILFVMMNGKLPFKSKHETCTLEILTKRCLPEEDVLNLLLKKDPEERISVMEILNHEWFHGQSLQEFTKFRHFLRSVKSC